MRCRPGDLAVVLTAGGGAQGAIVDVLRIKRPRCPTCGSLEWWVRYRGQEYGGCDKDLQPIHGPRRAVEAPAAVPLIAMEA